MGTLEYDASDLMKVAEFMNKTYGKPSTNQADLSYRVTLVVPPVLHSLSEWNSIPRTTSNFCYFINPVKAEGVFVRRYWCGRCHACKIFDFVGCTEKEYGEWKFVPFRSKKIKKKRREPISGQKLKKRRVNKS